MVTDNRNKVQNYSVGSVFHVAIGIANIVYERSISRRPNTWIGKIDKNIPYFTEYMTMIKIPEFQRRLEEIHRIVYSQASYTVMGWEDKGGEPRW